MKGFIGFLLDPFNLKGGDKKTYSEDGRVWFNKNGNIGINTEHPDYIKGVQDSLTEFNEVFNKGKDMRDLDKDRSNSLDRHFNNFTQWSNDRQIIQNGNILAQGLKLVSEVGELSDNLAKGRCIKDDIGDCFVVLNNLALMQGLTLNECLEQAWEDIKNRTGTMNEYGVFIKDTDIG